MTVLKGRLGPEPEMFVESTSFKVGLGNQPYNLLALELLERVPEAGEEVLSIEPTAAWNRSHVHSHACTIVTFKDHTGYQFPIGITEADSLSRTRDPICV